MNKVYSNLKLFSNLEGASLDKKQVVDLAVANLAFANSNSNMSKANDVVKFVNNQVILNGDNLAENKNNDPSIKISTKLIDEMPLITIRRSRRAICLLIFIL